MAEQTQPTRKEYPLLRQMTYDLIKRHPEIFKAVPPLTDILFVLDTEAEPTAGGRPVMARLSKVNGRVVDFVYDGNKEFLLEWFNANNRHLTLNQAYLLLAQQLLRFVQDGAKYGLAPWDIQEMELVAERFGYNWMNETKGDVTLPGYVFYEWKNGKYDYLQSAAAGQGETTAQ